MAHELIFRLIFIAISIGAFFLGIFISRRPLQIFALQQAFYRKINWHIEPVNVKKEIRNTRAMGQFLIYFVIVMNIYVWFVQ